MESFLTIVVSVFGGLELLKWFVSHIIDSPPSITNGNGLSNLLL